MPSTRTQTTTRELRLNAREAAALKAASGRGGRGTQGRGGFGRGGNTGRGDGRVTNPATPIPPAPVTQADTPDVFSSIMNIGTPGPNLY